MLHSFKPLLIATLIAAATSIAAQEADTTETTTAPVAAEAATDAPATDAAAGLDMGTEITAETAVGTPYVREEFGDWALRCIVAAEGETDPCQLYQLLNDADGNAVAEISMFPLQNGGQAAAGATIVVPLETLLPEQLQITVDGSATRRYPFTFCNRAGCAARVGFTQAEIDQFKRGNTATMRMVPAAAPEEEVVLNISLSGFTAGYDAAGQ